MLGGDLIHVRRPDLQVPSVQFCCPAPLQSLLQGWDGWLHVLPGGRPYCGLLLLTNPTLTRLVDTATVSLYYTGLTRTALVLQPDRGPGWAQHTLARDYTVTFQLDLQPTSVTYFVIRDGQ